METLKALLEIFPSRAPYLFMMFGAIVVLVGAVPFKVEKGGWKVQNPSTGGTRLLLIVFGLIVLGSSTYVASQTDEAEITKISRKRVASYFSYVTITGTEADCNIGKCVLSFRDSALVLAPKGKDVSYESRAKTGGRIVSFETIPRAIILNPEQYPANPTYLEFRIPPASNEARQLRAQGEIIIETKFSAARGKVGPYLPYYTDYVVVVVDMRALGFKIQAQVEPKLEIKRPDGSQVSGYDVPRLNVFEDGKVYVLTATDVPANSSVYISWGK